MKILMLMKSILSKDEINLTAPKKGILLIHFGNDSNATVMRQLLHLGSNTNGVL